MARAASKDVLDKFRWQVEIDGFGGTSSRAGFSTMQTPGYQISTREYREGGAHLHPRQIVDSITYTPIALTRGVTSDPGFDIWARGPFDITQVSNEVRNTTGIVNISQIENTIGAAAVGTLIGTDGRINEENQLILNTDQYRRDVTIKHLDRSGSVVKIYRIKNAIPIEYQPASDFDASADTEVSLERLVLKYESFTVETPTGDIIGKVIGNLFKDILP